MLSLIVLISGFEFLIEHGNSELLKPNIIRTVRDVIRVYHHTLLRQNGRFAWVCGNIDVIEALPGSICIPIPSRELNVPLIYEGLCENCALCGSSTHTIDKCPCSPSLPKIEIMVKNSKPIIFLVLLLLKLLLLVKLLRPRRSGSESPPRKGIDSPPLLPTFVCPKVELGSLNLRTPFCGLFVLPLLLRIKARLCLVRRITLMKILT